MLTRRDTRSLQRSKIRGRTGAHAALSRPTAPSDSEALVLRLVLRHGPLGQRELTRLSGLSQQSVSRLVGDLSARGALAPGERRNTGKRGQPSTTIRIARDYAYSFGVALMTDAISMALMDFSGAVIAVEQRDMPVMTRATVFDEIARIRDALLARHRIAVERVCGLGVGVSGYSMDGVGRFNTVHALDDWAMIDLPALFSQRFGLPVWVENDGNAAALGESLVGVGRTEASFVYLFIAAGVGGGVVLDHRLWRGVHGNAGEVALILPRNVYLHPSLETLRQIVVRNGVQVDGIAALLRQFDPDWPGVAEWIERTRDSVSLIVSAAAALFDPDAVVIGGRIPRALAERVLPHIEIYDNTRRREPRPMPRVVLSEIGEQACAIGAASLPLERLFFRLA